jgi:hypothetical protein
MSEKMMQNYVRPLAILGIPFSAGAIGVGGVSKFKVEHGQTAFLDYETANTVFFAGFAVALVSLFLLAIAANRKN